MIAILLVLAALNGPAMTVETLDGHQLTGQLAALDAGGISLDVDGQTRVLPLDTLLRATPGNGDPAAPVRSTKRPRVEVFGVNDSLLFGDDVHAKSGAFTLADGSGSDLRLNSKLIRAIRFDVLPDVSSPVWDEALASSSGSDVLLVVREGAVNVLEGIVRDINPEAVYFRLGDADEVPVPRKRVGAIVYYRVPGEPSPRPTCHVRLTDGQRLSVESISWSDAGEWRLKSTFGFEMGLPFDRVAELDYGSAKIRYLSDLEPTVERHTSFLDVDSTRFDTRDQLDRVSRDRDLDGEPLRIGGERFAKGLTLRSGTLLAYELPPGFQRFQATVGRRSTARKQDTVPLFIKADGRELWSGEVSSAGEPLRLDFPLDGIRRFEIASGYPPGLVSDGAIILGDARFIR
jgi:hypothetical protein